MLSERRIDECTNGAKRSFDILEVLYRNDISNSRLSILKVFYKILMIYYSFFITYCSFLIFYQRNCSFIFSLSINVVYHIADEIAIEDFSAVFISLLMELQYPFLQHVNMEHVKMKQ